MGLRRRGGGGGTGSSGSRASKTGSLSSCRSLLEGSGRPLSVVSSPARPPISRPALPRASSATSAFFFCGMIDHPVAYASPISPHPNSCNVQRTTSSPPPHTSPPPTPPPHTNPAPHSPPHPPPSP